MAERLQRLESGIAAGQIEHVDVAAELGAIDPADRGVQPLHADQDFGVGAEPFSDRRGDVGGIGAEAALHVGGKHPLGQCADRECHPEPGYQDRARDEDCPSFL